MYHEFSSMKDLVDYLIEHNRVLYKAPLSPSPVSIQVVSVTLNHRDINKSRAKIWTPGTLTLDIKLSEHFDRFRVVE